MKFPQSRRNQRSQVGVEKKWNQAEKFTIVTKHVHVHKEWHALMPSSTELRYHTMFDVLLEDKNSHDNDIGNHGNHDNNNGNTRLFIAHIRMIVSQETPWMCRCCYCCWCFFSLLLGHTKNKLAYNWLTWIIPKVNHFFLFIQYTL